MSYICSYSNEIVSNQPLHFVPTELRKVKYNYYCRNKNPYTNEIKDEYLFTSEGYETVKEVAVSDANYKKFQSENTPKFVQTKDVKIYIPKPIQKTEFTFNHSNDSSESIE